jgi:copper/silver efflux system protein
VYRKLKPGRSGDGALRVDIRDRDLGGYVADAQRAVQASIQFPAGYYVVWSGQYEYLERAAARLKIVVPATLLIIFLLLYLNFRSITETMIVMLSLPFALVGGLWLMWWLGFNLSVAVAVGFIALDPMGSFYRNSTSKEVLGVRVKPRRAASLTRARMAASISAGHLRLSDLSSCAAVALARCFGFMSITIMLCGVPCR